LKMGDVFRDAALLSAARQDAERALSEDAKLLRSEHAGLRARLLALYEKEWDWVDLA